MSAVERLRHSKSKYVKSESVLEAHQIPKFSNHLQVTTIPSLDLCHRRLSFIKQKYKRNASLSSDVPDNAAEKVPCSAVLNCGRTYQSSESTGSNHYKSLPDLSNSNPDHPNKPFYCYSGVVQRSVQSRLREEEAKLVPDYPNRLLGYTHNDSSQPIQDKFANFPNSSVLVRSKSFGYDARKAMQFRHELGFPEYSGRSVDSSSAYYPLSNCAIRDHIPLIQANSDISPIDRNARIIKWLYSCRKYQESYRQ